MRVLLIAFRFPPANFIGAIRVGKLARYLDRRGHDVRVLTTDLCEDRSLPVEIDGTRIIYTPFCARKDWLSVAAAFFKRRNAILAEGSGTIAGNSRAAILRNSIRRNYYALVHIPDLRASWAHTAIPLGRKLLTEWQAEVVFASGPPHTGLVIAARLGEEFGIPWVADLRDLWAENPYYEFPNWRRRIDRIIERRTLRSASALTTISPQLAKVLHASHKKRIEVVFNGYAEEDFPTGCVADVDEDGPLLIRYTGSIYAGFRDPSALFQALASMDATTRSEVRIEFIGDATHVLALATRHNVSEQVVVLPRVPYQAALKLQLCADILLLLQWNNEQEAGSIPAKLFEYLFARRPILFLGYENGIAAQMVRERRAGIVSNSPDALREQLKVWLRAKRAKRLGRLRETVHRGLSREEQFGRLETLLGEVAGRPRVSRPGPRSSPVG